MPRVMIIDDEPLARQGLRELLSAQPGVEIVAECGSTPEAISMIRQFKPEALFLDIRMPGMGGFDLLSTLNPCPSVVFVTAYSEYAAKAFDFQAVDYLLKPVRPARLAQAIQRLRAVLSPDIPEPPYQMPDRICLRTPERTIVAPVQDVLCLRAEKDFTRIAVDGYPEILICQAIGIYERNLPSPPFSRLDRSLIVNLSRVHSVEVSPTRGARLCLNGLEEPLPLGKAALRRLKQALPHSLSGLT